ncbi:MAG: hypothetical protein WBC91_18375, partial [Phototrophicaceae bacterium]
MTETPAMRRLLFMTLLIGFILRIAFVASQGLFDLSLTGGDEFWYIANGIGLFMPDPNGAFLGYSYEVSTLGVAPLYLIFIGFIEQ